MALNEKELNALTREMLFKKYDGRCAFCGCQLVARWHVCGIQPLKSSVGPKGNVIIGDDSYENKLPACVPCSLARIQHSHGGLIDIESFRKSLYWSMEFLQHDANYKKAIRYGLIIETNEPIIFYFEKV